MLINWLVGSAMTSFSFLRKVPEFALSTSLIRSVPFCGYCCYSVQEGKIYLVEFSLDLSAEYVRLL